MLVKDFPHLEHVEGWLQPEALYFTSYYRSRFLGSQEFRSVEIGVHHGLFFLGLERLTPASMPCIAIDLFEDQARNIDGSGKGDLGIFRENVERHAIAPERCRAIMSDSFDIDTRDLGRTQFGLVSIDGGHTKKHTINDLLIAQDLVSDRGCIILDDILNQGWLGVVSGALSFFESNQSTRIAPFAIGFNKLYACTFSRAEEVKRVLMHEDGNLLKHNFGIWPNKYTEFGSHRIVELVKA